MNESNKIIVGFLTVLILASAIYITFNNQLRIRVDNDKTTFYTKNSNNRFVVSGREYNLLFDGTKRMNRNIKQIFINYYRDDDTVTIIRETRYIRGPLIVDTYDFYGTEEDPELFPVSHLVEIYNASGKFYRYEVRDLQYDGDSKSLSTTSMRFGRNMKVTWQGGYRWAKVYKSGIVKVQYDILTNYERYYVKLFDPPVLPSDVEYGVNKNCYSETYQTKERDICTKNIPENATSPARKIEYNCNPRIVDRSKRVCIDYGFNVSIPGSKKSLDFSSFGKCSETTVSDTLIITCDSARDGNGDGICKSGESCVQFRITKSKMDTLYKNSEESFTTDSKSFVLRKPTLE